MNRVIFDLNSQVEYMSKENDILETMQFIIIGAIEEGIPTIGTILIDDYIMHPKYKETLCAHETNIYFVSNLGHGIDMELANNVDQIYFETRNSIYDQRDNINTYLRTNNVDTITIIGADSIDSLSDVMLFMTNMKYNVELVYDGIGVDISEVSDISGVNVITAQELINDLGRHNG